MNNKPKFFFDYIFYRVAEFYHKWDGENGITAILFVSTTQVLTVVCFMGIMYKTVLDPEITAKFHSYNKVFVMVLLGSISIFNYFNFRNKLSDYRAYWKGEEKQIRALKGFLIIISFILPWIPIILMGTIFK